MEQERIQQILTYKQLAELLFKAFDSRMSSTSVNDFKGLPICRTEYFQLKKGNMLLSLTKLNKVCEYLKLPTPKIFL